MDFYRVGAVPSLLRVKKILKRNGTYWGSSFNVRVHILRTDIFASAHRHQQRAAPFYAEAFVSVGIWDSVASPSHL